LKSVASKGLAAAGTGPAKSGRAKAVDGKAAGKEPPWHALAIGNRRKIGAAAQAPATRNVPSSLVQNGGFHGI